MKTAPQASVHTHRPWSWLSVPVALGIALTACGPSGPSGTADTTAPSVHITSAADSGSADYTLTGLAFDNVGVTLASYTIGDGEAQALTVAGQAFSAELTLTLGTNQIGVSARDAAGNVGSTSLTVTYSESGPDGPAPSGLSLSSDVAAKGESITISGNDFGADGTVDIGGIDAIIDSWSEGSVELTVPENAPSGQQTLTLHAPGGSASVELFVGVHFPVGTLDELAALALPRGTAVLLDAGSYTMTATTLTLDNLSLYGQGEGATTVNTGSAPKALIIHVAPGQDLVFQDLRLHTDATTLVPNPVGPLGASAGAEAFVGGPYGSPADIASAARAAWRASPEAHGPQTHALAGTITLRSLTLLEHSGGAGLVVGDLATSRLYGGDIFVSDLSYTATGSSLVLLAGGDIQVEDSQLNVGSYGFLSFAGRVDVHASQLFGGSFSGIVSGSGVIGFGGLGVTDSELRSQGPILQVLAGDAVYDPFLPAPAQTTIRGNTFRAIELNPAALPANHAGVLLLNFAAGDTLIQDNLFVAQRGVDLNHGAGSVLLEGNDFVIGHAAIPLSLWQIGHALQFNSHLEFRDNTVEWLREGGLSIESAYTLVLDGNEFSNGTAGSGTALSLTQLIGVPGPIDRDWDITVTDNVFHDFLNALRLESPLAAQGHITAAIVGNHFDFEFTAAPQVATLVGIDDATLNADGNRWGNIVSAATANGYILEGAGTTPGILTINDVISGP